MSIPGDRPGRILGVVTARAGSKAIPGKNTRLLAGRPLIAYTIDAAREAGVFDRLILSTDDPGAAAIARERGCEVPFTRPAELSADDTPHLPVMQHALTWLRDRDHYSPDWVMILLPTSPLRQLAPLAMPLPPHLLPLSTTHPPPSLHPTRRAPPRWSTATRSMRQQPP